MTAANDRDDSEAALRPVGGVADIQVVGALSDRVVELLALQTAARSVWMHPKSVSHIIGQRGKDSEFVLQHLPRAVLQPHFVGIEFRDRSRVRLVHRMDDHDCHLHVAVKLVVASAAGSGFDEFWVSTAYRMGSQSLTRMRNKTTLWRVED